MKIDMSNLKGFKVDDAEKYAKMQQFWPQQHFWP